MRKGVLLGCGQTRRCVGAVETPRKGGVAMGAREGCPAPAALYTG